MKVAVNWSELGIKGKQQVRDLWRQKDVGDFDSDLSLMVPRHGTVFVTVSTRALTRGCHVEGARIARPGRAVVTLPLSTTTWPTDDHVRNARRGNRRVFVRRSIDDGGRIEDRQVGVGADARRGPSSPSPGTRASRRCAGSSVIWRSASISVHRVLVAHILAEHLGERARRARVPAAVLDESVARDHGERTGDGGARLLLGFARG